MAGDGMRNWHTPPRKKGRIEIIPMIDVMMFLLVFFVLISVNVIPALGIKTQLPHSSQVQSLKTPAKTVVVTLATEGGARVDGRPVALEQLAAAVRAAAAGAEKISVVVNSDQGVEVQRLVDVMDELKSKGFDSLALAAKRRE
jgi:biopolymer transport protein ExbD